MVLIMSIFRTDSDGARVTRLYCTDGKWDGRQYGDTELAKHLRGDGGNITK